MVTDDNGTCGNAWAIDTEKRTFTVKRNSDGSYRVTRNDRGTLPDQCRSEPRRLRDEGQARRDRPRRHPGKFHGYLRGTVTGGTFNPNAHLPGRLWLHRCLDRDVLRSERDVLVQRRLTRLQVRLPVHARKHQGLKFHHW